MSARDDFFDVLHQAETSAPVVADDTDDARAVFDHLKQRGYVFTPLGPLAEDETLAQRLSGNPDCEYPKCVTRGTKVCRWGEDLCDIKLKGICPDCGFWFCQCGEAFDE